MPPIREPFIDTGAAPQTLAAEREVFRDIDVGIARPLALPAHEVLLPSASARDQVGSETDGDDRVPPTLAERDADPAALVPENQAPPIDRLPERSGQIDELAEAPEAPEVLEVPEVPEVPEAPVTPLADLEKETEQETGKDAENSTAAVAPEISRAPVRSAGDVFDSARVRIVRDRASAHGLSELIRALYLDQSNFTFNTIAELDAEDRELAQSLVAAWLADPSAVERWEEIYDTVREGHAVSR